MKKVIILLALICLSIQLLIGQNVSGSGDRGDPKPVAWWKFDSDHSRKVVDQVSMIEDSIEGNYKLVDGIEGKALKLDGFTTVIKRSGSGVPKLSVSFSFEAWIAAATYPWNWCPILSQARKEEAGFYFGIGPQGQAGLFASVNGIWQKCETNAKIPLRKWTHLVATYDEKSGFAIYINGVLSGQSGVTGKIVAASESDLLIGMNSEKTVPSNPVRPYATVPSWFSFDGIYDEVKIYNASLSYQEISKLFATATNIQPPDIPKRVMPSGPEGKGRFGAYYTNLKYYDEWDALWRVGDYSDIVIEFDNSPIRVVFWRGTRYSPVWVMENGQWMADQGAEYFDTINGCFEHMMDRHCLYSNVKIIENSEARVVINWRYTPVSVRNQLAQVDEKTGWSDCTDEYYTFYPDGIGIRKIVEYTSGLPSGPSEAIVLCQPGTRPEDNVNLDAMTLVNLKGESYTYTWEKGAPKFKRGENPVNPIIQIVNLKSHYKPFMIFEKENRMAVYGIEQRLNVSHFPWWNHWPVAQIHSDGRYSQDSDQPSHFSLAWGGPPFHTQSGEIIIARESGSEGELGSAFQPNPNNRFWLTWMYGASQKTPKELARLAKSWTQPPVLNINGSSFVSKGYDLTQRAYILESNGEKNDHLEMELLASNESPVVNACFVIKGWDSDEISVKLDGKILEKKKDYRTGIKRNLEKDELILWIKIDSDKASKIIINRL
jgi:hypothetical protein